MAAFTRYASLALILAGLRPTAAGRDVPFLNQGFSFDYTRTDEPVPIPTTAQCDTIPLKWGRAAFTTGPNPTSPYSIQVYTSTFLFPMVIDVGDGLSFDWPVPFNPGTQYQICMFDANGASGGCQRMTTVVPAANSSLNNPPVCTNLTYPAPDHVLGVDGQDHTGPLSQFGWIDQCTDISIKPLNGTAPFTLTVAPTLHPPWNITSNDMSAINWTVQLSWGSPFFISLVDANGLSWAFGPLHSGGQGPTNCLDLTAASTGGNVGQAVAIGSGVGGLIGGLLVGGLITWLVLRRRSGPHFDPYDSDRIHNIGGKSEGHGLDSPTRNTSHYSALPLSSHSPNLSESYPRSPRSTDASLNRRPPILAPGSGYEVEPFRLPGDVASDTMSSQNHGEGSTRELPNPHSVIERSVSSPRSPTGTIAPPQSDSGASSHQPGVSSQPQQRSAASHVYVVHHDGGRAPVSVYTPEGTEVIELPPRYEGGSDGGRPQLQQHRSAGSLPRKGPRSPGPGSSGSP